MKLNHKKIGKFYKCLNEAERIYLQDVIITVSRINKIRHLFLDTHDFCDYFNIKFNQVFDFINGNFLYSMIHLSKIQAKINELKTTEK